MIDVVLCASGSDEVRIVHDLSRDHREDARVVRRCADLAETLAVAAAGIGDVVLIDLGVRGLGRDPLASLLRDAAVVGLRAPEDGERTALGLRHVVDPAAPVATILEVLRAAVAGDVDEDAAWTVPAEEESPGEPGRLAVVWGPGGAPGRSTVAVNLAAEAARAGEEVVLVDADTYGPALSQVLGVLDEAPGLVAACRAYDRDTLDEDTLDALLPLVQPGLRLLSGIGVPARWPELRRSALEGVWGALRRRGGLVVADVAAVLEEDEELSYDTAAPQRNAAALTALQRADVLLAVVGADPISLTRLLRERARLQELGAPAMEVLVNRVGSPVPGERVRELLDQRLPGVPVHLLPDDPAACRAARWDGALLAEAAPRSALRRSLREIAGSAALLGEEAAPVIDEEPIRGPWPRWRRLVPIGGG